MHTLTDEIPQGWLECNGQTITRERHPLLYDTLKDKYGSGENCQTQKTGLSVTQGNGLSVGEVQEQNISHTHGIGHIIANNDAGLIIGEWTMELIIQSLSTDKRSWHSKIDVDSSALKKGRLPLKTAKT